MESPLTYPGVSRIAPERMPRWRRLSGGASDLLLGVGFLLVATAGAFAWLLAMTRGGSADPGSLTTSIAWALVLAAVPAWLGVLGACMAATSEEAATPGQRRAGVAVLGAPRRRLLRLAVHPLGAVGWWWAALVAMFATVPGLPVLLAAVGIVVGGSGVISAMLLLLNPAATPLHDHLASTRMVAR